MADKDGRLDTGGVQQDRPSGRTRPATTRAGGVPEPRPARGHLRIYLGSAAGVGKTYAMLGEGHRRAERGADVVVGFAEAHGRPQTSALLDGLEVIPRARLEYRGASFEEMDLDAVLARRPEIALVDELAHTNVPGSRNEKRWQDIEELLDAGIDVISAVNIQHLESLNDVVEKITGVPQRETVPDTIVRAADQVEMVDMTPEALRRWPASGGWSNRWAAPITRWSATTSRKPCSPSPGPRTRPSSSWVPAAGPGWPPCSPVPASGHGPSAAPAISTCTSSRTARWAAAGACHGPAGRSRGAGRWPGMCWPPRFCRR